MMSKSTLPKSIKVVDSTICDRFCRNYKIVEGRIKTLKSCFELFQNFVDIHFADKKSLDASEGILRTRFITFLRCNNALYHEHSYIYEGIVTTAYQEEESEDIDDWTETNSSRLTNASINWLLLHADKAVRGSKKNKEQENFCEVANLSLDSHNSWLADMRQQLRENIEHLIQLGVEVIHKFNEKQHPLIHEP